jgi:hypothetical protein
MNAASQPRNSTCETAQKGGEQTSGDAILSAKLNDFIESLDGE